MSNPYEKYPGKGFKYIPGYNPPAGTMADAEKRRIEEMEYRKKQEEKDRYWRQQEENQRRDREAANKRKEEQKRRKEKASRQKQKKRPQTSTKTKSNNSFSEIAGVIAFIISAGYMYTEMEVGGGESIVAGVVIGVIIRYTITIILTIGVIFLIGSLLFSDGEQNTQKNTSIQEPVSTSIASGRYYLGFQGKDLKYFTYEGKKYHYGVQITSLFKGYPAQISGLRVNDVIYEIDDSQVYNIKTIINYINSDYGKEVSLSIIRNGKIKVITVRPKYKS